MEMQWTDVPLCEWTGDLARGCILMVALVLRVCQAKATKTGGWPQNIPCIVIHFTFSGIDRNE